MSRRDKAAELLAHYFEVVFTRAGLDWDYDKQSEIEELVDALIAAAAEAGEQS